MNEHGQVEQTNRVRGELLDIHISRDQFALGGIKLLVLLGQAERGRHAFVSDLVREEVPVVSHPFHQNDRVGREGLGELPVEVGFADVGHGKQLDGLAVVASVFSHSNRQATRAQCQEAVAEMADCQGGAKDKIDNHSRHQHEEVGEQEDRQVPPAKAPGLKLVCGNQRPAELKPALDQKEDAQAEDDLTERDDPGNLLKPTVAIDGKWNYGQCSDRIEECEREKQALGDHGSEPHQDIDYEGHEHGQKAHNPAEPGKEVDTRQEDQRVIQQGNDRIG